MQNKLSRRTRSNRLVWMLACILFIPLFLAGQEGMNSQNGKDSFNLENWKNIFTDHNFKANKLWQSKKSKTIKQVFTSTFTGLPLLVLDDRDNDGLADEFSYRADHKSGRTQEFGFFFDMDRNGKTDYLVFNGGPLFTKDFSKMFWMNYHLIDANGDGAIDIFIFNGINLKKESFYDEGVTAWLVDLDFDGIFDWAEYLGEDFRQPIPRLEGKFLISSAMGETSFLENRDLTLWKKVLIDIDTAVKK